MKLFNSYQILSKKEKLNIIFESYGSITDFSHQQYGYGVVSKKLRLKPTAVQQVLVRLKRYNFDVSRLVNKCLRPDKKRSVIGSEELEKYLVSKECLIMHAHLSLLQRSAWLEQERGLQVSAKRIARMYQAHGVKYKFTKRTLSSARNPPDILEERRK